MKESPLFIKTYDLAKWLLEHTAKFPRSQRHILAHRIEDAILSFQELLLWAVKDSNARAVTLLKASYELERLRLCVRLSTDMKLLSIKQYEFVSHQMVEVGNMLGGWIKKK
ncbi:MAG: diversity-generating retroelement protein Avd [Deltaproteobacteria bacterium]|nr:diversity-generating retroelement protein Avd [Deltaproteobacteria bacterium]